MNGLEARFPDTFSIRITLPSSKSATTTDAFVESITARAEGVSIA